MSLETAAQLGKRINEHALAHGLKKVSVTLHGGEPLLATVDYLRQFCTAIRKQTKEPHAKIECGPEYYQHPNARFSDGER